MDPLQQKRTSSQPLILVGLLIALLFGSELLGAFLGARLTFPRDAVGHSELLQRIREHLIGDEVALAGPLVCLVFFWRKLSDAGRILLSMSALAAFHGWRVLVIFWKTDQVMDPDLATTSWPTLKAYTQDPVIFGGQISIALAGAALLAFQIWRTVRSSTPAMSTTSAASAASDPPIASGS